MADYKRLVLLVFIMTAVAIVVGATALGVFYDAAFEREQQRLVNIAESQARLMAALGPAGLPQVIEEQRRLRQEAVGKTAELQLARREGESIVFLTPAQGSNQAPAPVAFGGPLATPMTEALSGRSGTMIGRDYAGRRVLAAYETLPALGLGLVAKINMTEINGRYLRAGLIAVFVSLIMVVGAALLFIRLSEPMIRRTRESEARLRAVLDACPDEIMMVSTDGIVLATNEAAERRMTRRSGERDPVGDHLGQLLPPDEAEQKMATIGQVASTLTVVYRESEVRSRSYECWYFPAYSPDRSVDAVAVYARDVSEQKKMLAAVRKLSQAIEHSPSTVFITDSEGTIEYVNPKFTELTGYTSAEAVGQNPRMLKSGQTPPEHYAELWNTIRSGGVWRGELLNKKKNGELYWEFASIAPVKDGQTITNFVAVMEDITQHREREEQLRQAQKMEAVGQLTGGIAHDFNNLLAIVIGNLQLLQERVSGDREAQEYLDDAIWSTKRGGELTRRLLAFARKQPLKPAVVDLNDIVRGMGEMLRRTLGATIEVKEVLASDLSKAVVDGRELEQVLINLAVNSRDAMPSGGTLVLTTRNVELGEDYAAQYEEVTPGDYALIEIVDTGTGMPPEIVSRVFDPFFTTKEFGKGSGLGLSMVYGFAKQSHGHVSIYSQVGRGTCVKLYLPRAPSASPRMADPSADVSTAGLAGKVVLVVEDEAKLRKVAVAMLERLGVTSVQAENAENALELLARTYVDALFTDIELPGGMNGLDLAEAARRLAPDIKVLFTTGYTRESVQGGRLLQEQAPWLIKPYSYPDLARVLQELLVSTVH